MTGSAMARAGGGGGGGKGGILVWLLLPFFYIAYLIRSKWVKKKNEEAKDIMLQAAMKDHSWNYDEIIKRVEEIFFKVQYAWMERDQDIAKDFISSRLYEKHKLQTDQMIKQHRKNVLENINIIEAAIVEAKDYPDDKEDSIWVYIEGSMIDYTIDDRSMKVISGKENEIESFEELWKMVKSENGWVLDYIDQKVSMSDLKKLHSFRIDKQ